MELLTIMSDWASSKNKSKKYTHLCILVRSEGWEVQRELNPPKDGPIISYLPTPPLGKDVTQGQFLSEV